MITVIKHSYISVSTTRETVQRSVERVTLRIACQSPIRHDSLPIYNAYETIHTAKQKKLKLQYSWRIRESRTVRRTEATVIEE